MGPITADHLMNLYFSLVVNFFTISSLEKKYFFLILIETE